MHTQLDLSMNQYTSNLLPSKPSISTTTDRRSDIQTTICVEPSIQAPCWQPLQVILSLGHALSFTFIYSLSFCMCLKFTHACACILHVVVLSLAVALQLPQTLGLNLRRVKNLERDKRRHTLWNNWAQVALEQQVDSPIAFAQTMMCEASVV